MGDHLDGADPLNPITTQVFADMFQRAAHEMPDMALPMLSLTLARAVQRLYAQTVRDDCS